MIDSEEGHKDEHGALAGAKIFVLQVLNLETPGNYK